MNKTLQGVVGLLGGTFNPVHIGHLRMAIEVRETLGLDRIDFLPAKSPPHKEHQDILDYDLRLNMVADAIAGINGLGLCAIESELPVPSYSWATIKRLQDRDAKTRYAFVLGSSDLLTLLEWHQGRQIPFLTDLIVVGRERVDNVAVFAFLQQHWESTYISENVLGIKNGRTVFFIDIPRMDVSATLIREKFCQNQEIAGLVPDVVRMYMLCNKEGIQQRWSVGSTI